MEGAVAEAAASAAATCNSKAGEEEGLRAPLALAACLATVNGASCSPSASASVGTPWALDFEDERMRSVVSVAAVDLQRRAYIAGMTQNPNCTSQLTFPLGEVAISLQFVTQYLPAEVVKR